jgi:hypothetical protein
VFTKRIFFISLFLASCSAQKCPDACRSDLISMKDELALAQKKLLQQQAYVESLEEQIARNEIELIKKEISQVNKQESAKKMLSHDEWLAFFYQQREILDHIIRYHPTCRLEAQGALDAILTLITQISDQSIE